MKAFANYRSHASGLSSPPLACPSSNSTEWNRRERERVSRDFDSTEGRLLQEDSRGNREELFFFMV